VSATQQGLGICVTVNQIQSKHCSTGGSCSSKAGDTLRPLLSSSLMKDKIKAGTEPERLLMIHADLQIPDCRKSREHTGREPEIPYEKTMMDILDCCAPA